MRSAARSPTSPSGPRPRAPWRGSPCACWSWPNRSKPATSASARAARRRRCRRRAGAARPFRSMRRSPPPLPAATGSSWSPTARWWPARTIAVAPAAKPVRAASRPPPSGRTPAPGIATPRISTRPGSRRCSMRRPRSRCRFRSLAPVAARSEAQFPVRLPRPARGRSQEQGRRRRRARLRRPAVLPARLLLVEDGPALRLARLRSRKRHRGRPRCGALISDNSTPAEGKEPLVAFANSCACWPTRCTRAAARTALDDERPITIR